MRVLQIDSRTTLESEIRRVTGEPATAEQLDRASFHVVKLEAAPLTLARLLFQELAMEGGQVITAPRLPHVGEGETDMLLCATRYQFAHLATRLRWQASEELQLLADGIETALDRVEMPLRGKLTLGRTTLEWGARTYVMGIVNVTPDSFSGDALLKGREDPDAVGEAAVQQARVFLADGADIIDVGGESTRPGAAAVPAEVERARVVPVIRRLARETDAAIAIDTYKAEVAQAALEAGAHLVNDVWGLQADPEMKEVIAAAHAPVVLMHNRSRRENVARTELLGGRYVGMAYNDLLGDILRELEGQVELARSAGIADDRIILDPGIGFGKTREQNLELVNRLGELRVLGFPILLGPSRKGFIGYTLNLPVEERLEGTLAAVTLGIARGADMVRVHDVKAAVRAARMADAMVRDH